MERMRRVQQYQEAEWLQQQDQQRPDAAGNEEDADAVADELYCVACDKFFKTANAMANHERYAQKHITIVSTSAQIWNCHSVRTSDVTSK